MHATSMRTQVKSYVRRPLAVHASTYPETLIPILCLAHLFHLLCLFLKHFFHMFVRICAFVLYACRL